MTVSEQTTLGHLVQFQKSESKLPPLQLVAQSVFKHILYWFPILYILSKLFRLLQILLNVKIVLCNTDSILGSGVPTAGAASFVVPPKTLKRAKEFGKKHTKFRRKQDKISKQKIF